MRNILGVLTLNQQVTGSSPVGCTFGAKSKGLCAIFYCNGIKPALKSNSIGKNLVIKFIFHTSVQDKLKLESIL
ncbi:MAG: hypothetical protein P4L27_14980 [Ignavibacteriaceae bacterium]|nr:hypothetical protein [Ignavibacteriaceae bacterium]